MSDTPQGGWWRASDGKWYPPEVHPDRQVPDDAVAPPADPDPDPDPAPEPVRRPEPDPNRGTFDLGPRVTPDAPAAPVAPIADPPTPRRPLFGGGGGGGDVGGADLGTTQPSPARPPSAPAPGIVPDPSAPTSGSSDDAGDATAERLRDPIAAPWPASSPGADGAAAATRGDEPPDPESEDQEAARRRRMLVFGGILALVLVIAGVVVFLSRGDDEVAESTTTSAPASTTTSTPASSTTSAPSSVAPSAPVEAAPVPAQATGVGTATVQVGRPVTEPYLALITHDGPGAMSFELLDAGGGVVQDLVAGLDSGQYLGVVPVNFGGGEFTAVRFTGEGPWAVTFAVPDSAPDLAVVPGSSISRSGDWVVSFAGDAAAPLAVECSQCTSPIEVRAWSATATATPDPLEVDGGRISVPAGTAYLQVTATGTPGAPAPEWSLGVA